jgi:hypothetical protein
MTTMASSRAVPSSKPADATDAFDDGFSVMSTKGIPIPDGAPNANARLERFTDAPRRRSTTSSSQRRTVRRVCRSSWSTTTGRGPRKRSSRFRIRIPSFKSPRRKGRLVALPVLGGLERDYRLWHRRVRQRGRGPFRGSDKGRWRQPTLRVLIFELIEPFSGYFSPRSRAQASGSTGMGRCGPSRAKHGPFCCG